MISFLGFWLYFKYVYHDLIPTREHVRSAHLLFSLLDFVWVRGNASYFFMFILWFNSTRIELYHVRWHWNNLPFMLFHLVKNLPIALNFHWAHVNNFSGAYTVAILVMDVIAWVLYETRRRGDLGDYLSVRVYV